MVEQRGSVQALHSLDPFARGSLDGPAVWRCRPSDDAIVLGSRQTEDVLDLDACADAGLHVARRRSGGGAVIVRRDSVHWIDVVAPLRGAATDVTGSMVWIGEIWRDVLAEVIPKALTVHRGRLVSTPWSDLVCFAGIGPGEVSVAGRKLVGLSQRRTRQGIRVQCLVHARSLDHEYPALFGPPTPPGGPDSTAALSGVDVDAVISALADRITTV